MRESNIDLREHSIRLKFFTRLRNTGCFAKIEIKKYINNVREIFGFFLFVCIAVDRKTVSLAPQFAKVKDVAGQRNRHAFTPINQRIVYVPIVGLLSCFVIIIVNCFTLLKS